MGNFSPLLSICKHHRKEDEKNLSLRRAAETLGVSYTYLNILEKGYNPTTEIPQQISIVYKTPVEKLLLSNQDADEEDACKAHRICFVKPSNNSADTLISSLVYIQMLLARHLE